MCAFLLKRERKKYRMPYIKHSYKSIIGYNGVSEWILFLLEIISSLKQETFCEMVRNMFSKYLIKHLQLKLYFLVCDLSLLNFVL